MTGDPPVQTVLPASPPELRSAVGFQSHPAASAEAESKAEEAASYLHHYLIIRDDLGRGPSHAQLAHAAARSSDGLHTEGTHVVILAAKSERELWDLEYRLQVDQIPHILIQEPDPPFNNQATAIGLRPCRKNGWKKYLKHFRKLEEKEIMETNKQETKNEGEKHRSHFRFTNGTRSLIRRLKKLIKQAEADRRLNREWNRTPYGQRPLEEPGISAKAATLLYTIRAFMRGHTHHFQDKMDAGWEQKTKDFIEAQLKSFEDHEKWRQKSDAKWSHPVFPAWIRATLRACIAATELEKKRKENHAARFAKHAGRSAA